jgi:hypothetical protein
MKEAIVEFAPICGGYYTVVWTDHQNNTRISLMPPDKCGEKVIRWWGEIMRPGVNIRFLAGKLNPSDGFSRNPQDRDEVLARRAHLLANPAELEKEFTRAEYEDALTAEELSAARRPWLEALHEGWAGAATTAEYVATADVVSLEIRVLFVPSWTGPGADQVQRSLVPEEQRGGVDVTLLVHAAEQCFTTDEGSPVWFRFLYAGNPETRRKLLRRQLLTSVVDLWRQTLRHQARVVVAHGAGAVIATLLYNGAVREAAAKSRFVSPDERATLDAAWARVHAVVCVRPAVHLRPGRLNLVLEACPELQPSVGPVAVYELGRDDAAIGEGRELSAFCVGSTVHVRSGHRGWPGVVNLPVPVGALYDVDDAGAQEWLFYAGPVSGDGRGSECREIFAGRAAMTKAWCDAGLRTAAPFDRLYGPE